MIDDLETGTGTATIDTSVAAEERLAGDAAAAPKPKLSVAAAGAAFLASLKPEQLNTELGGVDLEEGDAAEEGAGAAAAAESITRPEDGATFKPELGRWVDAAGKIVAGAPPEGAPAPKAKPAPVAAAPAAAPPAPNPAAADAAAADAPAGSGAIEKITLPGIGDRGEEDIELEIDDPAVAERLRRLAKDGLRAGAAREQRAALDADRAQLTEVTAAIEDDPIGFVMRRMSPDRQLEVARAVLLERFDELLPDIEELSADPTARANKRVELRDRMTASEREAVDSRNARAYAGRVISAVEALLPDDVDPKDAREFVAYSRQHLAELARQGQSVTPETVKTLLARQLKFAGFSGQPTPAPAAAPAASAARPAVPVAKPATDAARAIAARSPTAEEATRTAQRVRRVQTQRAAATRVAPAGAGAAPVSVPLLTPEQRVDVRTASKALMKKGLPETWAGAE